MADTATIHSRAVEQARQITVEAEAEISEIVQQTEENIGELLQHNEADEVDDQIREMIADSRSRAQVIAERAQSDIQQLLDDPGHQDDKQVLMAVLQAAVKQQQPGIRISEQIMEPEAEQTIDDDSPVFEFEGFLNSIMRPMFMNLDEALENMDDHDSHGHAHSDTVVLNGREVTIPGGIYTVVFGVLAVVTLLEVALAESPLPRGIEIPILAALSIAKAVIVVMYYMHIKDDSRIFVWAFAIPLAMAALIIFFVMAINPFGYG